MIISNPIIFIPALASELAAAMTPLEAVPGSPSPAQDVLWLLGVVSASVVSKITRLVVVTAHQLEHLQARTPTSACRPLPGTSAMAAPSLATDSGERVQTSAGHWRQAND